MTSIQRLYLNLGSDEVLDVSNMNLATGQGALVVKKDAATARYQAPSPRKTLPGGLIRLEMRFPTLIPGQYDDYYKPADWNPPIISNKLPQFIMSLHYIFGPRGVSVYENDITLAARQLNRDVQRTQAPRVTLPPRSPPRSPPRGTVRHGTGGTTLVPAVQKRETNLPFILPREPVISPRTPTVTRPTVPTVPTVPRPGLTRFSPPRTTFQPTTTMFAKYPVADRYRTMSNRDLYLEIVERGLVDRIPNLPGGIFNPNLLDKQSLIAVLAYADR